MSNKRICRHARRLDTARRYTPQGSNNTVVQQIQLDQFEAIRLVDAEGLSQIDAAKEMGVSRATIQRLLHSARKTVTEALLWNHTIEINNSTTDIKLKGEHNMNIAEKHQKTIAFPTSDRVTIDHHFGHTKEFVLYTIEDNEPTNRTLITPPPHKPGVIPAFLRGEYVDLIITGGMGQRALSLFKHHNIDVILGATGSIEDNLSEYLGGSLASSGSACGHHGEEHEHKDHCGNHSHAKTDHCQEKHHTT